MSDAVDLLREAARDLRVQAEHQSELVAGPDVASIPADLARSVQAVGFYAAAIAVEAVALALEAEREAA